MEELKQETQLTDYEKEMIAKVDEKEAQIQESLKTDEQIMETVKEDTEKLAGKYETIEDLKKGIENVGGDLPEYILNSMNEEALVQYYKELESNIGKKETETENVTEETAKETVEEKGFNFDELSKEFEQNGDLTEETYKKLSEAGIPKEMVDTYIQGQQAILNQKVQEIYNTIGGEKEYNEMIDWAKENLTETEIKAFDQAIGVSDEVAQFTIQTLHSRYKGSVGGKLIDGTGKGSSDFVGYETKSDMIKDMSSSMYEKDATFRARVQKKIQNTKFL